MQKYVCIEAMSDRFAIQLNIAYPHISNKNFFQMKWRALKKFKIRIDTFSIRTGRIEKEPGNQK